MLQKRSLTSIDTIVLHCSASDEKKHDNVATIDRWHKMRGWDCIGYHFFISKDGEVWEGRKLDTVGAHVKGHNKTTVGICLSGLNTFTEAQMKSTKELITRIKRTLSKSNIDIKGHNEYTTGKTCPNFVVKDFLKMKLVIITKYPR